MARRAFADVGGSLSFKRKAPHPPPFSLPSFFHSPWRNQGRATPPGADAQRARGNGVQPRTDASASTEAILPYLNAPSDPLNLDREAKDSAALDWYVEGPGRRVGYDDLTAIDWIFEYAKERQRLRILHGSAKGISGYVLQIADASQIWGVLIATGIAAGTIAAFIDVASGWLGDIKAGVCGNVETGGRFYFPKEFCCWGVDGEAVYGVACFN
jgi:chloride channel 3/4/5